MAINTTLGPRRGELCHLSRRYWDSALLLSDFWNVANSYQAESNDLIRCSSSFESKDVVLFLSTTHNPPPHHLSLGSARGSIGDYYRSFLLHGLIRNESASVEVTLVQTLRIDERVTVHRLTWRSNRSFDFGSNGIANSEIWSHLAFLCSTDKKNTSEKERCLPSSSAMARWPNNE